MCREPAREFIVHPLVLTHGWWPRVMVYKRCGRGRLFPSKLSPRVAGEGVSNLQQIYASVEGLTRFPTSFSGSLLSPRIHPVPPTLRNTAWLTVQ